MLDLALLYTLTGNAVIEQLGKVQDGERIKIEFRGQAAPDSPIAGKAHGSNWILVGPSGPSRTNAVQEIVTPAGERLVLELQGYTQAGIGEDMEIHAAGIIRTTAAAFAHLNGQVAVVVQDITAGHAITIRAYAF